MSNNAVLQFSSADIRRDIQGRTRGLRRKLFWPVCIYVLPQSVFINLPYIYVIFPDIFQKLLPYKAAYAPYRSLMALALFCLGVFVNILILGFIAIGCFAMIQKYLNHSRDAHVRLAGCFCCYRQVIFLSVVTTMALCCIHILCDMLVDLFARPGISSSLVSIPYINLSILGVIQLALQFIIFLIFLLSLCHAISMPKLSSIGCLKSFMALITSRIVSIIRLNIITFVLMASAVAIIILFAVGASLIIGFFGFGVAISGGFAPVAIIALFVIMLLLLLWLAVVSVNWIATYCLLFINSVYRHLQS